MSHRSFIYGGVSDVKREVIKLPFGYDKERETPTPLKVKPRLSFKVLFHRPVE